ncbi:MAG: mannose-1-phosphate guanylyltransferase/mannose-6-phosphate isomerase [Proteobacteria bacterium]|nr:mannose-1-phosphate guanylyltransferase/mannose-6-phosphate isomerase [Pseudomonadota bacterium]
MIIPVILSGGAGTRLWPLSREMYPKQLLPLISERTMLQETALRLRGVEGAGAPIVVCNEAHRFMVAEQLRTIGVPAAAILLEPVGRNTAPAVALAALKAESLAPGATLIVAPADHVIRDTAAFRKAAQVAVAAAAEDKLVTFGVVAHAPETGYGYIRRGAGAGPAFPVAQFIEKPVLAKAREYVESGEYYWNSGMFVFKAARFLTELERFAPAMLAAARASLAAAKSDLDFIRVDKAAFEACPSDSIDYAVMEKTRDAMVVPLDAGWSDVGSWSSLFDSLPADEQGNVLRGDVLAHDSTDCFVHATSRLVAVVGLADHVVVETKDAVLVAPKTKVQDVKELVSRIKKSGRSEAGLHREVFRPWGSYDSIDFGDRFQVKRLTVKPGAVLSLQMHHHRAEHWIVVSGTARITCDDKVFLLSENESTYIPIGSRHRIENPGKVPLHIVEVQSGSYLGEDDIVRFEDNYGRQGTNT